MAWIIPSALGLLLVFLALHLQKKSSRERQKVANQAADRDRFLKTLQRSADDASISKELPPEDRAACANVLLGEFKLVQYAAYSLERLVAELQNLWWSKEHPEDFIDEQFSHLAPRTEFPCIQ